MPTTLDYFGAVDTEGVDTILVIGLKANLTAAKLPAEHSCDLYDALVAATKPGTDKGSAKSTSFLLAAAAAGGAGAGTGAGAADAALVSLVVVALPTACSRHNCTARPHAVTDAVVSHASGNTVIYLVNDNATDASAAGTAVASALPLYSRKTGSSTDSWVSVKLMNPTATPAIEADVATLSRISNIASGIRGAASLVDMPTSELNVSDYVKIVQETVDTLPDTATCKVLRDELRDDGFGGLWGVGKASMDPPALVVLSYTPEGDAAEGPVVAMAGKGIVYDTGGLSIKGKTFMPGMKRDMGGSAAVFHAFVTAVQNKYPRKLYALLCIAENSVGSNATRPDDILKMYSGKTVEVNNTDAEGRLVLGDGVAYAEKHCNPDVIIDMATLTGAQGISTGRRHGALYCNDEGLENLAIAAGKACGDLVHPLPYAPEFFRAEFASAVADMKNSVANRSNAQSSCAGQFIGNHLSDSFLETKRWLHIDMASPSYRGSSALWRATGYGVHLLVDILDSLKA